MPIPGATVIEHGRVRLRPARREDQERIVAWRNRDDVRTWFLNPGLLTLAQAHAWFDAYASRQTDQQFIIEDVASGRPVGAVSLYDVRPGQAEVGRIMIGEPDARGRGLAEDALRGVVGFARRVLGPRALVAQVLAHNGRSRRLFEAAGFRLAQAEGDTVWYRLDP